MRHSHRPKLLLDVQALPFLARHANRRQLKVRFPHSATELVTPSGTFYWPFAVPKHPGLQKDTRSWLIEAWAWNPAAAQKQNHPIFNGIVNDV